MKLLEPVLQLANQAGDLFLQVLGAHDVVIVFPGGVSVRRG
jgi:hypothetical protein